MHTRRRSPAVVAAPLLLFAAPAAAQKDASFLKDVEDQPKVAIIQYESGRVVVLREVNGALQAIEPSEYNLDVLQRFLTPVRQSQHTVQQPPVPGPQPAPPGPATPDTAVDEEGYPFFYNPYWYAPRDFVNTDERNDASPEGRAAERLEQRAAEARQQVIARRTELGEAGMTNLSGRVFPMTAAEQEQYDRLSNAARSSNSDAYGGRDPNISFYSLGFGLEEYRQQEVAARKELALLSYDVLMREGLQFFHERQYGMAARAFIGASRKDQGDAASRLHAAQALMANGLYSEAMVHVRRAFELLPALIHRPLVHRSGYTYPNDYDEHLAELEFHVQSHPEDTDALALLAYQKFYSQEPAAAREDLRILKQHAAEDAFARKLLNAAQPVVGRL